MYSYSPMYFIRQDHYWEWTPSKVELNRKLRALWEQHVYWTRLTVNSIAEGLPDVSSTTERLLRRFCCCFSYCIWSSDC